MKWGGGSCGDCFFFRWKCKVLMDLTTPPFSAMGSSRHWFMLARDINRGFRNRLSLSAKDEDCDGNVACSYNIAFSTLWKMDLMVARLHDPVVGTFRRKTHKTPKAQRLLASGGGERDEHPCKSCITAHTVLYNRLQLWNAGFMESSYVIQKLGIAK